MYPTVLCCRSEVYHLQEISVQDLEGKKYRVHKHVSVAQKSDLSNIVYAEHSSAGWLWRVPQCGAVFEYEFAIDLHLEAHGGPELKWYCGDVSCHVDSGEFRDYKDWEGHMAVEHMDSTYSRAAGRCVGPMDPLYSMLRTQLNIKEVAEHDFNCSSQIDASDNLVEMQHIEQEEDTSRDPNSCETPETEIADGSSKMFYICPWPGCAYRIKASRYTKRHVAVHVLTVHLGCVWQCHEQECSYVGFVTLRQLERHRLYCHVGSPLQCGHNDCSQVFPNMTYPSRGHLTYDALQKHYEYHLNSTRADSANAHDSDVDPNGSTVASTAELQRPSDAEYKQAYRGGSSKYFTPERRQNRLEANLKFYQLKLSNIKADGAKTCAGFWLKGHHFECADQVSLGLETTMIVFVPSAGLFTVVAHLRLLCPRHVSDLAASCTVAGSVQFWPEDFHHWT